MFKPEVIILDIETKDSRSASFEYFRDDFEIFGLALSWRNKQGEIESWFDTRSQSIYNRLKWLSDNQIKLVTWNLSFEYGVLWRLYPELNLNFWYDGMRLAILRDTGGNEFNQPALTMEQELEIALGETTEEELRKSWVKSLGNSLEACARRYLGEQNHDHKKAAHDYLKEKHGVTKNFGGNLHLLPFDKLKQYNIADTETTLLIFESCMAYFKTENFNLVPDYQLYTMRVKHISEAYVRGLKIDQDKLLKYILEIETEIKTIEDEFFETFRKDLRKVRKWIYLEKRMEMLALKTMRSQQNRWAKYMDTATELLQFNLNSNARHLPMLFLGVLRIKPKFRSAKGAPSFKASHLHQWNEGGKILIKRKKRLLVLQQAVNIYIASLYDGKLHPQVKAAGTRTNRVSSGR